MNHREIGFVRSCIFALFVNSSTQSLSLWIFCSKFQNKPIYALNHPSLYYQRKHNISYIAYYKVKNNNSCLRKKIYKIYKIYFITREGLPPRNRRCHLFYIYYQSSQNFIYIISKLLYILSKVRELLFERKFEVVWEVPQVRTRLGEAFMLS